MTVPRLFLVAPDRPPAGVAACLAAACEAGDVASLLVPASLARELAPPAQARGVAVLVAGDAAMARRAGCDGAQVAAEAAAVAEARAILGKESIVGAFAAASRHAAMEAAEAGADYIAFGQHSRAVGEPIVGWWSEFFEIPCVAFDPLAGDELDTLLPQNPDFIRPDETMWNGPETAGRIVATLMERLTRR